MYKDMINTYTHICVHSKVSEKILSPGRASLVVQRLRICLAMQGTLVQSLAWKNPPCGVASKPLGPNHRTHAP